MNIKRILPVISIVLGFFLLGFYLLRFTLPVPAAPYQPQSIRPASSEMPVAREEPKDWHFTWKAGGPTPKGDFLFIDWELEDPHGARIYLLSDYGFMLLNEGTVKHPKVVYLLGFRKRKEIRAYRTLSAFRSALKRIPHGSTVYYHGVCTSGTAPGVGEEAMDKVKVAFRKARLKFDEDNHVLYCICGPGADPYPSTPKELKDRYVHLYGLAAFNQNYLGRGEKPVQ